MHSDSHGTTLVYLSNSEKSGSLSFGIFSAVFFYILQKRMQMAWKLGFLFFSTYSLVVSIGVIVGLRQNTGVLDFSSFWFPAILAETFNLVLLLYLISWWKKQREYFIR